MTDRRAYQAEWARNKRAGKPTCREKRLEAALREVETADWIFEWTATPDNPELHRVVRPGRFARIATNALEEK